MEPNKLENQFKEKLNNREINPSEAAWDRLDAMLSLADSSPDSYQSKGLAPQKSKRKLSWLYVAASIMGLLFVGQLFFRPKENLIEIQKNNVVVENAIPKEASKSETKLPKIEPSLPKPSLKKETNPLVQTSKSTLNKLENLIVNTQVEVAVETKPRSQNESLILNKSSILTNIDSLLASVENQNPVAKKAAIKINSTSLLNQVDGELQVSFREKALNTITKKYKEAKEALANRNNQ